MPSDLQYKRIQPKVALRPIINYYWVMDNLGRPQDIADLIVPDGYAEIIFILSGGYEKRLVKEESLTHIVNNSSVIGLQRDSVFVRRTGHAKIIGVKFKPLGFYLLLGAQGVEAVKRTIPLDDFGDNGLITLDAKLSNRNIDNQIKDLLDKEFTHRLSNLPPPNKTFNILSRVIEKILAEQGNLKVSELAIKYDLSKKQLERYFKRYIGIPPKAFISIIRFKQMYKNYVLSENRASHFFDAGYYDQSHFIQDFKKYTGVSPRMTKDEGFMNSNDIAKKSSR